MDKIFRLPDIQVKINLDGQAIRIDRHRLEMITFRATGELKNNSLNPAENKVSQFIVPTEGNMNDPCSVKGELRHLREAVLQYIIKVKVPSSNHRYKPADAI